MSILKSCLSYSSFKINILDPKTDEVKHILIFFWDLPSNIGKILKSGITKTHHTELKKYFGADFKKILEIDQSPDSKKKVKGGDDLDINFENLQDSDIKNYDNVLEEVKLSRVNYITDIMIFPEDSFWTIRQKIYVVTKIPIYRQHLFYLSQNLHKTGYYISNQEVDYPINKAKDTRDIMGIKVDQNLYFNKDNIKIRTEETCTILDDIMEEQLFLYDLDDYGLNKHSLASDVISFNIIYYSLIKKYFPIMDDKMFKKYLENEQGLISEYPLINLGIDMLVSKFADEKKILLAAYNQSEKLHDKYADKITIELIDLEAKTLSLDQNSLKIRNLVDLIKTDSTYILVDSYITNNRAKYRVVKYWVGLEQEVLTQVTKHREEYFGQDFVVVYIAIDQDVHNLYIYADSSYLIKYNFSKTHDVTFSNLLPKTEKYITPILEIINSNKTYLFSEVMDYTLANISLGKIHAKIKWPKVFNDRQFNEIVNILSKYNNAGIIVKRNIQPKLNTYSAKIMKGMTKTNVRLYLKKGTESADYYVIFKDFKTNETWNSRWGGENIDIINTMVNITFEVFGMDNTKFVRTINYLFGLMYQIDKGVPDMPITKKDAIAKTGKNNKKKFKETDPKLYDMEDEKGTKYARICQKKHRPINIYSADEYGELPTSEKKHTYPFINYTTGETVYYKCSDKMPYLGFIIGKHPDGYCIPKCKESNTDGIKNRQIQNLCTKNFTANKSDIKTKTHNENILKFGKQLIKDKVGFCHESVYLTFNMERDDILMIGCDNHFHKVNGGKILDILAYVLNIDPNVLVDMIISKIDNNIWISLVSSTMVFEEFLVILDQIKNEQVVNKIDITDIIIELAPLIFGINVVLFETHIIQNAELFNKNNSSIYIKYTDVTKFSATSKKPMTFIMICKLYDDYYPIILPDGEVNDVKIFEAGTKFSDNIASIVRRIETLNTNPYTMFEYSRLMKVANIVAKYVWQKYILYVEFSDGTIIGCYNSINVTDDIKEIHNFLDIPNLKNKCDNTLKFLTSHINEVPIFISDKNNYIIGARIGPIFAWFGSSDLDEIKKYYPKFNIEYLQHNPADVNNAIVNNILPEQKYNIGLTKLYYDVYIYKLMKCEFYKLMMKHRDLSTHNKIVDKLTANELTSYLQNNPGAFPYSMNKILQIAKYNSDPKSVLKKELFIEDIIGVRNKLSTRDDLLEFLRGIIARFCIMVDEIGDYKIGNILYSHLEFDDVKITQDKWDFKIISPDDNSLFYKDGKLKIVGDIFPNLMKMIVEDVKNYDMFRYEILNFQLMFVINYLNFRNYDGEKILIQSL